MQISRFTVTLDIEAILEVKLVLIKILLLRGKTINYKMVAMDDF